MFDHDISLFDEPMTPQERETFKWRLQNRELPYASPGQVFGKSKIWSSKEYLYVLSMREAYSVFRHMGMFGYGVARMKEQEGEKLYCELPHESPRPIANFALTGKKSVMIAFCEPCLIDLLRCFGANITTSGIVSRRLKDEPMLQADVGIYKNVCSWYNICI
jgi:hypothetical protein